MATMAIVRRNSFEKNAEPNERKPGTVLKWQRYQSNHPRISDTATQQEPLVLVTVRKERGQERLWLVALYPSIRWDNDSNSWCSTKRNNIPITDITDLRSKLKFDNGRGILPTPGRLGQSLQTPRLLAADDMALVTTALAKSRQTTNSSADIPRTTIPVPARSPNMRSHSSRTAAVFNEGGTKEITREITRRDARLKSATVAERGTTCMVCDFSFSEFYGESGEGYIELHHLRPLSTRKGRTQRATTKDVIVVCANCHRVLHRNGAKPMDWQELREIVKRRHREEKVSR